MAKRKVRSPVEKLLTTLERPRGRKIGKRHLQHYKSVVVLALEKGHSLNAISRALAVHRTTIYRWRESDADFDDAFGAARAVGDGVRLMMVEDRFYKDLLHGRCTSAERIFFLVNRAPDKWQDVHKVAFDWDKATGEGLIPLGLVRKAVAEAEALDAPGVTPISKAKRKKARG